jgi:TolB protein
MKKILCFFAFLSLSMQTYASPRIFLEITKNFREKAEIVLLLKSEQNEYWETFQKTLSRDLEYSDYFTVEEARFEKNLSAAVKRYSTELILTGEKNKEEIKIKVADLLDEKTLFEKTYRQITDPFHLAHTVNNDIILELTGKPGIAGSQILFVSDKTGKSQIYSLDYDGRNLKKLTDASYLIQYPEWSEKKGELLVLSYEKGYPEIARIDINTGKTDTLISYPGLNACAALCRQTKQIAVILSKTGNPEIYLTDLEGNILKRLTYSRSTESSPSLSPNGEKITFVSDRQGTPQIYVMDKDGYNVKRISYVSGYSTSPAWSADGNYIAYVFSQKGIFGMAVYELKTQKTKIINSSLGCEELSWADDSRHIVYSRTNIRPSTLMIIDIITGQTRRLTSGECNAFSPCWAVD